MNPDFQEGGHGNPTFCSVPQPPVARESEEVGTVGRTEGRTEEGLRISLAPRSFLSHIPVQFPVLLGRSSKLKFSFETLYLMLCLHCGSKIHTEGMNSTGR